MFKAPPPKNLVDNLAARTKIRRRASDRYRRAEGYLRASEENEWAAVAALKASLVENGIKAYEPEIGTYLFKVVSFSRWPAGKTQLLVYVTDGPKYGSLFIVPCDETGKPPGALAFILQTHQYRV